MTELSDTNLVQRFLFDPDSGKIILRAGKVEIGQHIFTAFEKIVAEALEVNSAHIRMFPVGTEVSPDDGMTVGSLSIQVTGAAIRAAAMSLRSVLFNQAAVKLQSNIQDIALDADNLEFHAKEQRCSIFTLPLAEELSVAMHSVADSIQLIPSPSIAASIRGEHEYIQDLVLSEMIHARAIRSPVLNADELENVKVIKVSGFTALLAETEVALEHAWSHLQTEPFAEDTTRDTSCDGPVENWIQKRKTLVETSGDTAVKGSISQTATRPFILHASIAPSCAIACYKNGLLEIWTHSQGIFPLRDTLAHHLNKDADKIIVRHVPSAGCYGHNAADDAVLDAVLVCLQTDGKPVRVSWTRQDDFQHAPVGAPMHVKIDASLGKDNSISDWQHTIWSGPHGQRPGAAGNINLLAAIEQDVQNKSTSIPDLPIAIGSGAARNALPPYSVGSFAMESHVIQDLPVRTSSIRGLGSQMNVVCIEAMMDKLAKSCALDPLAFRLQHIIDPRAREVLSKLNTSIETSSLPEDEAIGFGYSRYKEKAAYAAVAARIKLTENVELLDVRAVVDAGRIIDRSGALNQIEGGIIQAASWTLHEGALLRDGYIDAAGWDDYPIISWSGIPCVHTTLVNEHSELPSLGVGECMVGPVSAAIVNAVSTAAGYSMTDLPITTEKFILAAG